MASIPWDSDPWQAPDSIPWFETCPEEECPETEIVVQEGAPGYTWIATCNKGHVAFIHKRTDDS